MNKDDIWNILQNNIIEVVPDVSRQDINLDAQLKELGINSVDRVEIIINTMESLELKIPLVEFGEVDNIEELIDFLYSKKVG